MDLPTSKNNRSSANIPLWLDVRGRKAGMWAFVFNRLTGLGLVLYLGLHLVALSQLATGPQAYDSFVALAHNPIFGLGELLVVAAGFYHGLNGLRIALNSFGVGVQRQQALFYATFAIAALATAVFAVKMFFA
jgi:succinate dehydrogenase / fumarate reductase, cytochrome b subunit